MKVSEIVREVVMEPEGMSVEVMTVAPGGSTSVPAETGADREADAEAGKYQEPPVLDGDLTNDAELGFELTIWSESSE